MTETILDESAVSEIEKRIDSFPLSPFQARALCATVKHLRAENEELRARLNDPCLVAGYHVCGGVHKAGGPWKDFRTRAIQLCNDKAAGYRQGAEGSLARETWIDRAEVAENLATELEKL